MVGALTPFAIVLGGAVAAALIFSSFWQRFAGRVRSFGSLYAREIEIGDFNVKEEDLGYMVAAFAAVLWIVAIVLLRPSLFVGALLLPVVVGLCLYGTKVYLRARVRRRVKQFAGQLEGVLRSLSSGVRVGLGLRQALIHVAAQTKDPARKELTRVIGAANLGVSIFDALDELGRRLPTAETKMMARVIRVQAQAGGDLAGVLDGLAETIRDRRRLDRRIRAITSQSRASAWLLGLLPLAIGAFTFLTQPAMRDAMMTTSLGHISLILGLGLDAAAVFVLMRMTDFDA